MSRGAGIRQTWLGDLGQVPQLSEPFCHLQSGDNVEPTQGVGMTVNSEAWEVLLQLLGKVAGW